MMQKVRDVMSGEPIVLRKEQPISDAARAMRDGAVGSVLVVDGGTLCGLVTDRDIVVRGLAESAGPETPVGRMCSPDVVAVRADDETEEAAQLMRDNAVRRLPVLDEEQIVGIVSLGDLAVEHDKRSALADISAARPNT